MTTAIDIPPQPGETIRVRSRRYLLQAVEPGNTPGDQTLVRLACLEDDAEGEELEVLWEKEVDAQRITTADWTRLASGQFVEACGWRATARSCRVPTRAAAPPTMKTSGRRRRFVRSLRDQAPKCFPRPVPTARPRSLLRPCRSTRSLDGCISGSPGFDDAAVWKEVDRRRSGAKPTPRGMRDAEVETLASVTNETGSDRPGGDFYARAVRVATAGSMAKIARVVKVHRLREVIVQVGFTRFEAAVPDVNGELELGVERAALSLNQSWLPAVENRGEGVFVSVSKEAIETWLQRAGVRARGEQLQAGYEAWRASHSPPSRTPFIGLPYVMLHTLSHLLATAVSLDCGYAVSSIRERVYAVPAGFGVLLYTASPDAEGTLGALVESAERLPFYLEQALSRGELCSNDPVCSQHYADSAEEGRYLLGAACHGCVLLPESSCERRNDYLDRALVVPTVDSDGAAFFDLS